MERKIATALRGKRVLRGADFSQEGVDVEVPDFPGLKIDAKYRKSGWSHHTYLKEIARKYCKQPGDLALLVTKTGSEHGECVTMTLEAFAVMLDHIRKIDFERQQLLAGLVPVDLEPGQVIAVPTPEPEIVTDDRVPLGTMGVLGDNGEIVDASNIGVDPEADSE